MPYIQKFAVGLVVLGSLVALLNWLYLFLAWRTKRFHSPIPLVGAVCLGAGMLLLPATRVYAWVAILVDYGTLAFLIALPCLIAEIWNTCRCNLLEEFVGKQGAKTVYLRLFRNGIFILEQHYSRQHDECGVLRVSTIGAWERDRERIRLRRSEKLAEFEVLATTEPEELRQVVGFLGDEDRPELSMAGIDLKRHFKRSIN